MISISQLRKLRHRELGYLPKVVWKVALYQGRACVTKTDGGGLLRTHNGSKGFTGLLGPGPHTEPLMWLSCPHIDAAVHATNTWTQSWRPVFVALPFRCYLMSFHLHLPPLPSKFLPCFLFQSPTRERICLALLIFLTQISEVTSCSADTRLGRCPPWSSGPWREEYDDGIWPKAWLSRWQGLAATIISPRTGCRHNFPARFYLLTSNPYHLWEGHHGTNC